MYKMTIQGRLTEDAQVRATKDGGSFLSMRVAVNSFENGSQKPYFISVAHFNYRPNMVQHLTKGSLVDVVGTPQISAYLTKQGSPMEDIRITADAVEFPSNGSNSGTTTTTQTSTVTSTPEVAPTVTRVQRTPAPEPVEEEIVMTTTPRRKEANTEKFDAPAAGSDDLPF